MIDEIYIFGGQQLGPENAKPLSNPCADEVKRPDDSVELNANYTTQYKPIVARANYLAADRIDIQYAVKTLATSMAKPTNGDWRPVLARRDNEKPTRTVFQLSWRV